MRKTLFIVGSDMNTQPNSVNKVMLRRSRLLSNPQFKPVLLTINFNKNYELIERELRATGQLHPEVELLNLYDYYRAKFSTKEISQKSQELYRKNRSKFEDDFWVEDGGDYARYFENGHYVKFKRWDKNGNLTYIDYFDENRVRISREEFHPIGYLARETLFHPKNNKKNQENYYTPDGFCYLTVWFNFETGAQQRVFLFDPEFPKAIDFKNRVEFQSYWIAELCRLEAVKPIVIAEGIAMAERVAPLSDELTYKVFMWHSNHLCAPYTQGSGFLKAAEAAVEVIPKGYATVVLTEAQKLDLHSDSGNRGNIMVVPLAVESAGSNVAREENLFTMVTRLTAERQVSHAIQAMELVCKEFKDARLEIYGTGAERKKLKELITSLKLDENIQLMGYQTAIDDVYSRSLATVVTSKSAGTSLAMQEAASNATPTIAYEINYGPAQYITHNENGLLVEADQIKQLAGAMIYALEHPQRMNELGEAAQQQAQQLFTDQQFRDGWLEVLDFAIHHSPKMNMI